MFTAVDRRGCDRDGHRDGDGDGVGDGDTRWPAADERSTVDRAAVDRERGLLDDLRERRVGVTGPREVLA